MSFLWQAWDKVMSLFYTPRDVHIDKLRKNLIVAIGVAVGLGRLSSFHTMGDQPPVAVFIIVAQAIFILSSLAYMCATKQCSVVFTEVVLCIGTVFVVMTEDFRTYGVVDAWNLLMVMMDLYLLCVCRERTVSVMFGVSTLYIIFRSVEQTTDLGIYSNLPDISVYEKPVTRKASDVGMQTIFNRLAVVITDFALTRYFANNMVSEKERMARSVEMAERVAASLVLFDLEAAERVLKDSGDIGSNGLEEPLQQLLENLRSYRPYLPDALFTHRDEAKEILHADSPPTAPPQGRAAIVFTDIMSSTAIWEACPGAMREAMKVHNNTIREAIAVHNGYEVKTIGDAFMIAFSNASDAVRFALDAQNALQMHTDWPEELAEAGEHAQWGLMVRMGCHVGEVDSHPNPLTGRWDYFGPTVNLAARVERQAKGGSLAITDAVARALGEGWEKNFGGSDGSFSRLRVDSLGSLSLKGFAERVVVWQVGHRNTLRSLSPSPSDSPCHSPCSSNTVINLKSFRRNVEQRTGTVATTLIDLGGCTVATLQTTFDGILGAIIDSIERSDGKVGAVGNSSVLGTWNIAKPCAGHALQGARFAALLGKVTRYAGRLRVGVVSGAVTHGSAGTEQQRFIVNIGQCIDVAGGLAAAAKSAKAFALAGAIPKHLCIADDVSMRHVVREIDRWVVPGGVMPVYQINVECLIRGFESSENVQWGWSDEYAEAVAMQKTVLLRVMGDRDSDPTLSVVAALLETNSHLQHPFPLGIPDMLETGDDDEAGPP